MRLSPICMPYPQLLIFLQSNSGNRLNSVGLEHAPCLTPLCIRKDFDILRFRMRLDRSDLYSDLSISIVCGSMPSSVKRLNRWSLFTLSKAFFMSISHMWRLSPRVDCIYDSSSRVSIYSAQLLPFLKPACSSDNLLFFSKYYVIYLLINLSIILIQKFISEIGLWFEGSCRSDVPFGSRQMCAMLRSCGISAVDQMCSMSFIVICSAACPPCRISSAVIPSGPGAFLFGIPLSSWRI